LAKNSFSDRREDKGVSFYDGFRALCVAVEIYRVGHSA
jgi:hypothetical protein